MSSPRLKEEGNALFAKGAFREASDKYTLAIELDCKNPVLYANRAACALNLKEYHDALQDAQQALGNVPVSITSWEKALEHIPEKMTPADEKHVARCEAALKTAEEAHMQFINKTKGDHYVMAVPKLGKSTWEIAETMIDDLQRRKDYNSCVWLILSARADFEQAMSAINSIRFVDGSGNTKGMFGNSGVLVSLSNAIMMDERIFTITDPNFMEKYNQTVLLEVNRIKPWTNETLEQVTTEAPLRLQREGWDSVRPAISTTVRGYLLRGFFQAGLTGNHSEAVRFKRLAMDILEWGAKEWENVSNDKRGSAFTRTFKRGMKVMLLISYSQACNPQRTVGPDDTIVPLEGLRELAQEILQEVDSDDDDTSKYPPYITQGFFVYPRSYALSSLGFFHKCRTMDGSTPEEKEENFIAAAKYYHEAAELLPPDEEKKIWYMNAELEMLLRSGSPLSVTLPLISKMRKMAPKMQRLWVNSSLQRGGRDIALKRMWEFEDEIREMIAEGKVTLEDAALPAVYQ